MMAPRAEEQPAHDQRQTAKHPIPPRLRTLPTNYHSTFPYVSKAPHQARRSGEGRYRRMSTIKPVAVRLLPVPGETLTPEVARRWLSEELPRWAIVTVQGYQVKDPAVRSAFGLLACDLAALAEACGRALRIGIPQIVGSIDPGDPSSPARSRSWEASSMPWTPIRRELTDSHSKRSTRSFSGAFVSWASYPEEESRRDSNPPAARSRIPPRLAPLRRLSGSGRGPRCVIGKPSARV
jgi:hypothetical protein